MLLRPTPRQITYFISAIGILIGITNLGLKLVGELNNISIINLFFSGSQLFIVYIIVFFHFDSLSDLSLIDDISKKPADIILKNVEKKKVNNVIEKSKRTVESCHSLWFLIILTWLFSYLIVFCYDLGIINFQQHREQLVFRVLNHIDSIEMLFMYNLFSISNVRFHLIFKRCRLFFGLIIILIILDSLITFGSIDLSLFNLKNAEFQAIFNVINGFISAIPFLMFFSRLDSILIQLNKFILSILMLYGVFQAIYPLLISSLMFSETKLILQSFLFFIGFLVSTISKVSLACLFYRKELLARLVYYFSSISLLTPFTANDLSILHTFYSIKTKQRK